MTDVEIAYSRPRHTPACDCGNQNGHRGVWLERGADNLVTRFRVSSPLVHDVTLSWTEMHTVVSEGWGEDLNVDNHRNSPYGGSRWGLGVCLGVSGGVWGLWGYVGVSVFGCGCRGAEMSP